MSRLPIFGLGFIFAALIASLTSTNFLGQLNPIDKSLVAPVTKSVNPTTDAAPRPSKTGFSESTPLVATDSSGSTYSVTVFVRNDESVPMQLLFSTTLQTQKGAPASPNVSVAPSDRTISENTTKAIPLTVDIGTAPPPLSGYLRMTTDATPGLTPSYNYRPLQIASKLPSPYASTVVIGSMICGVVVVFLALLLITKKGVPVSQRMGQPTWNFSDSWGSNIAIGAGLLSTFLNFGALPAYTHYMNRNAYLSLSLLFAGLITLAPSIYNLIRTPLITTDPLGNPTTVYLGYAGLFVIASGVTVWGAIGQLLTVVYLIAELDEARVIATAPMIAFLAVLTVVIVMFAIYGCRSIVQIALAQRQQKTQLDSVRGAATGNLPAWSLL